MPHFIKLGKGSFRTKDGRIIKENQKFEADIKDIPKAFRDLIIPADGSTYQKEDKKKIQRQGESPSYTKKASKAKEGRFHVYDKDRKRLTGRNPLSEEDADQLIADMEDE